MVARSLITAIAVISGVIAAGAPAIAFAQSAPNVVATYRDWNVFTRKTGDDLVCFAVSEPKDKSPKNVSHGDVFMLVSTWKSGVAREQPSFMAGYNFRDRSTPSVRVGTDKWDMYVSDNEAFIEKTVDEQKLLQAMRRGSTMRVQATSGRGTVTNYEISLLGISAALDRMTKECS
ncbi:MAG: invasion associated locus B family protein [Pseudomonadota bacterium]